MLFGFDEWIVYDKCLSINHENLEMVIYLKDWYNAKDRQQSSLREDRSSSGKWSKKLKIVIYPYIVKCKVS